MSDDISSDSQKMDCDNARPTTPTAAKANSRWLRRRPGTAVLIALGDPITISLASFLYGNAAETSPRRVIPSRFTHDD